MSPVEARLPRTLSTLETWGFGFTVLLFWLVVAPEVHETLGVGSLLVWLPAALAGIVVNLQIRRLALARPDAAGGSPVYVARLWADRPLVSRWSGLAYFHSWAIVPPAITWILADLAVDNLALLGFTVSSVPLQLALLAAIYLIAFSGVRVLSVVHLFFLIPSLGLLLALGLHGVGWLAAAEASPGLLPTAFELPSWSAWVAGYFVVAYTTYGIETAAAFSADSRHPRATINCLVAAAVLILPIMVGGSWLLARVGPPAGTGIDPATTLELAASPLWGGFTPFAVTFMLASSMLLVCVTSVALTPRVAWQLGRDGVLAPIFGELDRNGVPRIALAFTVGVALLHFGLEPVQMILIGGASWVGFWSLMHLGLWRRRGDPEVLWPRLALVLGIVEAGVLVVGGALAGGGWVAAGVAVPFVLIGFDEIVRTQVRVPRLMPSFDISRTPASEALEIVLVVSLILGVFLAGWTAGGLIGPPSNPPATRVFVISLLAASFLGVSWASWTSLRRLGLLDRSRSQLHDVIDTAMDAVIVVDREGVVCSANPAGERLFARPEGEVAGRLLRDLIPGLVGTPDQWVHWQEYELPAGEVTRVVELAARTHSALPWTEHTVTIRDLTDRKEAEATIRQSEQRLDAALEAARAGVWDLDPSTGRVIRSRRWEELLGFGAGDLEGRHREWVELLHPDDRDETLHLLEEHIAGRTGAFESEHRLRRSDGTWLWVMDRGRVVARSEEGNPVRMVGATVDITQRKHLEGQLGQARKMEAIGRLAGGVAHDFNNVLTAILGTAELLLSPDAALDREARRDVAEIRDAARRAGQITQQLLAFGRRQQLRATVIEPNDAIRHVEPLLRRLIGADVELRVDCHPDPGRIRADRVQLEQAIMNLALNARDAMPEGGSLTIRSRPVPITEALIGSVAGVEPGEGVELSVIDTGQGMDDATQARVFEPFFTTKEAGKGTGLGMAMVYGFVRQSGGFAKVESAPGQGTTVRLIFPRVAGDPASSGVGAPAESGRASHSGPLLPADPVVPGEGATILLAEDETGLRTLIERILTRAGYRVLVAADGDEALAIAARHRHEFDLLISDLVMPRMGGVQLADALRREAPDLRALFISGYPDRPGRDRPVSEAEGGPPAFLQKPFSPAELLREVHRILE